MFVLFGGAFPPPDFSTWTNFTLSDSSDALGCVKCLRSQHLLDYVIATNKRKVVLGEHLPRAIHASLWHDGLTSWGQCRQRRAAAGQSPSSPGPQTSGRLTNQGRQRGVRGDSEAQIKCLTSIHPSKPSPSIREQGRHPPATWSTSTPHLGRALCCDASKRDFSGRGNLLLPRSGEAAVWERAKYRWQYIYIYIYIVCACVRDHYCYYYYNYQPHNKSKDVRLQWSSGTMTALAGGLPRMMRPSPHQNYPRGGYSLEGRSNSWCLRRTVWSRKEVIQVQDWS